MQPIMKERLLQVEEETKEKLELSDFGSSSDDSDTEAPPEFGF